MGEECSDEAWEKIPKRNIDMESLFEQAKMTNLVTEEELRDAWHSFMAMNPADSCEIYADVINRIFWKNFELKVKEFQKGNNGISE